MRFSFPLSACFLSLMISPVFSLEQCKNYSPYSEQERTIKTIKIQEHVKTLSEIDPKMSEEDKKKATSVLSRFSLSEADKKVAYACALFLIFTLPHHEEADKKIADLLTMEWPTLSLSALGQLPAALYVIYTKFPNLIALNSRL